MVKLVRDTDSWRNSHSPCVLISSRENCVARDELENGTNLSSLSEVRGEDRKKVKEVRVCVGLKALSLSPQYMADPMVMLQLWVSNGNLWMSILQVEITFMSWSEVTRPS